MKGIAFGVADRRTIPEVDLVPVMHKLAESRRSAARLARLAQTWIEGTQFTTHLSIAANSVSTIEVAVEASRTFPHDAWSVQMAGFAHQARSALENLGSLSAEKFATSRYAKGGLQFPLCDDAHQWKNWVKKHPFLPAWLVARYYAIQPFAGPYKGLHGLRLYNNKDKHEWLRPVRLSLTGLLLESNFKVEGIHENEDVAGTLTPIDNVLNRHERRVKVSLWDVGHKVLELPETAPHDVQVELYFDMGHAEYSSEEIRELARRVQLAVQYVATGDPEVRAAYEAKPKFLSKNATQPRALVSTASEVRPSSAE